MTAAASVPGTARYLTNDMKLGPTLVPVLKPAIFRATRRSSEAGAPEREPSRILLVLPMKGIGDVVLALPAVRNLKRSLSRTAIDVLVVKQAAADLVSRYFPVDRVLLWDIDWPGRPVEGALLLGRLRNRRYDAVVDFMCDHSMSSALLSFLTGSPRAVGFSCSRRELFFNMTVVPDQRGSHMVDDWNRLVGLLGAGAEITKPSIELDEVQVAFARTFLEQAGVRDDEVIVSVHPGARDDIDRMEKRWPWRRFGDLCRRLMDEQGVRVVIHGSPREAELCRSVAGRAGKRTVVACGRTGMVELLSLLGVSDLFIGNNSGPLHAACALGVPTISFAGGVNLSRWGPVGPARRHRVMTPGPECRFSRCRSCSETGLGCLERVDIGTVLAEARSLLGQRTGGGRRAITDRRER